MTTPKMRRVVSSNISAVGYDFASQTLHVEFIGSGTYVFQRVPPEIDAGLREIEDVGGSVGRYFHHAIKSKFASTRLTETATERA